MAGAGQPADEQVRRRLSRPALLRRLRVRRRRRDARDRARAPSPLRRARGQRPAQFGFAGEPGGADGDGQAGRHAARDVARDGRAPDARLAGQPVGQVVQRRLVRAGRRRGHRLRRDGAARAPAQAAHHHRRRVRLFAAHRLGTVRQGGPRHRRDLHGRHGPLRRARRRRRLSEPDRPCRRHHLHDAQEPARTARRTHPDERPTTRRRSTRRSSRACRAGR